VGQWPRKLTLTYTWRDSTDPSTRHESTITLFTAQQVFVVYDALVATFRDGAKEREMKSLNRDDPSPVHTTPSPGIFVD
jgi:hypothetical protein